MDYWAARELVVFNKPQNIFHDQNSTDCNGQEKEREVATEVFKNL